MKVLFKKNKSTKKIDAPVYIFFDIDGVLNKETDWNKPFPINKNNIEIFTELITSLKDIYTYVRLVISSSWRAGYSKNNENDTPQIEELKSVFQRKGYDIYAATPLSNKGRQREIEYYIKRNNVNHYVVIDDEPSLYYDISLLHFCKVDSKTGISLDDVKKILKMHL